MGLSVLPEDCITRILSFTSPADVGRLSLVSKLFDAAAQSDAVWGTFLPPEYSNGAVFQSQRNMSKKALYLALCDRPVLIEDGRKSLSLEKHSGKKCYMLSARDLKITWGSDTRYWRWLPLPESRFSEVAVLITVCWLEIYGHINSGMLSKDTVYASYLVFKLTDDAYGLDDPVEVGIKVRDEARRGIACFVEERRAEVECQYPKERSDGWFEIELGEFFNDGSEQHNTEVGMSVLEISRLDWKGGLVVHGIEIRPKTGQ